MGSKVSSMVSKVSKTVRPTTGSVVSRTIHVSPDGHADFTTVQQAVDSVPSNNNAWIRISLKNAVYNEKVSIPEDKPFILLEGEDVDHTIIQTNEIGTSGFEYATLAVHAQNFVAKNIQFKNTHTMPKGGEMTWTTAAFVGADKIAFFDCGFYGQMDTLNDKRGRHYYKSCYIEGLVDFIWGGAKSIYEDCNIFIRSSSIRHGSRGYVTAQAREETTDDDSGFVFKGGSVSGDGPNGYLGRAYRACSKVLFYKTHISDNVAPEGWLIWDQHGHEATIEFAEEECTGAGSDKSGRVSWEKKLSPEEVKLLTDPATSIDQDGWLEALPSHN